MYVLRIDKQINLKRDNKKEKMTERTIDNFLKQKFNN